MGTNKTIETNEDVAEFLKNTTVGQKLEDSLALIDIFKKITGYEAKMWGPSIIGFGKYHYKYASGYEGEAAMIGFSPRKTAISLYVYAQDNESEALLKHLGKFKMGKACIYIKKLVDIHQDILAKLVHNTLIFLAKHHTIY